MSKRKSSSAAEPEPAADSASTPAERTDGDALPRLDAEPDLSPADFPTEQAPAPSPDGAPSGDGRNGEPPAPSSDAIHAGPRWNFTPTEGLSLEDRVRRLEDVVANLQQTHPELLAPTNDWRTTGPATSEFAPSVNRSTEPPLPPPARPSLLFELYVELRCIVRMIVDPRYRMSWSGKLLPLVFIFGLILSWWIISDIPIVGGVLDRTCSLLLAYFLYKVLGREAMRYRQTSPDLPEGLRL